MGLNGAWFKHKKMKKVLFIILILISGLTYAQNNVTGKTVRAIDKVVTDTIESISTSKQLVLSEDSLDFDNIRLSNSRITTAGNTTLTVTSGTGVVFFNNGGLSQIGDLTVDDLNFNATIIQSTSGNLGIQAAGGTINFSDENLTTSGTVTAGTVTISDSTLSTTDDVIAINDSLSVEGILRVNSNRITQVATPTQSTDAANKAYVDTNAGNVSNTGTPANNQLAVWTDATTIEGDANLTWSGTDLSITGDVSSDDGNLDEIYDKAGTGAPDFPNGLTIGGSSREILDYFNATSVSANGDLTGTIYMQRLDNFVTVWWTSMTHTSATSAASNSGLIPAAYRPTAETNNVYRATGSVVRNVTVATDGTITFNYFDWAGSGFSRGATDVGSITYRITP